MAAQLAHEGTETLDWARGWSQEGSPAWETPRTDETTERVNKCPSPGSPEMMLSRCGNSSCGVGLRAITRRRHHSANATCERVQEERDSSVSRGPEWHLQTVLLHPSVSRAELPIV